MTGTIQGASVSEELQVPSVRPVHWWETAVLGALILWLYWSTLGRLAAQWLHDPNFSHGFFVPSFSLLVVWQNRSRLLATPAKPSWIGLFVIAGALITLVVGLLGAELFLARSSLVFLLGGLIILFHGWERFRVLLFPWLMLFLMIPIPAIIFSQVTFPLQLLASKLATSALSLIGVPVLREGNVIKIPAMSLAVAEACSGIRSLLSLGALAIIYGYFVETSIALRVLMAIAAVPIAVGANALRIVGTGLLVQYWDPERGEGFFHGFSGWIIFIISLALLLTLHKIVRRLWPWPPAGTKQ